MDTEIRVGEKVYSLFLMEWVEVIKIKGDYALIEDSKHKTYETPLIHLETMDEHVENRLRLD